MQVEIGARFWQMADFVTKLVILRFRRFHSVCAFFPFSKAWGSNSFPRLFFWFSSFLSLGLFTPCPPSLSICAAQCLAANGGVARAPSARIPTGQRSPVPHVWTAKKSSTPLKTRDQDTKKANNGTTTGPKSFPPREKSFFRPLPRGLSPSPENDGVAVSVH